MAAKQVLERITYSVYQQVVRMLIDKDRFVYALLLALEIEDADGHVFPGEKEYIISPHFGAAVAGSLISFIALIFRNFFQYFPLNLCQINCSCSFIEFH